MYSKMELCKAWLSRSGSLPLSLGFGDNNDVSAAQCTDFAKLIIPYSHRWRRLTLFLPPKLVHDVLTGLPEGSVNMLEHLQLDPIIAARGEYRIEQTGLTVFQSAPKLCRLDWHCGPLNVSFFSWSLMTIVRIETLTLDDCFQVLSEATNLVTCILDIRSDQSVQAPMTIKLSVLRSLIITRSLSDNLPALFQALTCPALEELEISDQSDPVMPWSHHELCQFVSRTDAGQFRRFSIDGPSLDLSDNELLDCLRFMPQLVRLSVGDSKFEAPCFTDAVLHAMTDGRWENGPGGVHTRIGTLVPRLQELEIRGGFGYRDGALLQMVYSRHSREEPLQRLKLRSWRNVSRRILSILRSFEDFVVVVDLDEFDSQWESGED